MSTKPGQLRLEQRAFPAPPNTGHVTVKVEAVSICDADAETPAGLVPGHEVVGTVVQTADDNEFRIGDRVGGGYHSGHCGTCELCRAGKHILCKHQAVNGQTRDGCFGEYATLRTESLAKLPKQTKLSAAEIAPLLCPGVTVFNGIRNLGLEPGDSLLIQGIGSLGHLAIQFASKLGLHVIVASRGTSKRQLALDLGAKEFIDSEQQDLIKEVENRGGVAAAIALAPNAKSITELVHCLRPDGVLALIAIPQEDPQIPVLPMVLKRLRIQASPSGTGLDSEKAIKFALENNIKPIVDTYSFDNIQEAFDKMKTGSARFSKDKGKPHSNLMKTVRQKNFEHQLKAK
ncbi:hypothetical protein OIV83_005729 [Microbotryomycetes sp. JL201]|nr:hypothetical protein OIV83_005729 [Microbotryomycetes sp. JL201]